MVSVTSSRNRKPGRVVDLATLTQGLRETGNTEPIPLLVVRVRDLERTAWREGRHAARALERRSVRAFVDTASRVLRASDLLGHDAESEDFVATLTSPMREVGSVATPADCRAALARLGSAMTSGGVARVDTGWTLIRDVCGDNFLARAITVALERGARERERYDFFATIGHELRTPLTSIRGYLETLIEGELDARTARKFLEVARSEAERLGRLVDGLFELSLLDSRDDAPRAEASDLVSGIAAAINAVAPMAALRGSQMSLLSCERLNVALGGDRLTQIVVNLLENAIKHGCDGGRIEISSRRLNARLVEIRLDDDGPGVALDEREAVFSLSQRGRNVKAQGSGIGLAVVRLIVERAGGEVEATDSPLGGACFRVRLPLFESATPCAVPAPSPAP